MTDMNDFKERVGKTFENVAEKTKVFAGIAADKAKAMTRVAKLTLEINGEKDAMKKAYIEIGKLYYEKHRGDPDGFFVQLCDEVTMAMESIAAKEAEIAALKAEISDFGGGDDVDVEFETVVSKDEDDCCGGETPDVDTCGSGCDEDTDSQEYGGTYEDDSVKSE